jgi:PAS domain S-box-containing protein
MDTSAPPSQSASPRSARGIRLAALVLAVGLAGSLLAWKQSRDTVERLAYGRFEARIAELHTLIEGRMAAYPQVLRGIQAAVSASGHPTRADWARINQTLQVEQIYPGLTGTVYIRMVPGAQLDATLAEISAFEPGFAVKPPGRRDHYALVTSVEPRTPSNLPVIGSDSWAHPVRRATLQDATDSGEVRITQKLTLVIDDKPTPAFLMYQAVYKDSAVPDGLGPRRSSVMGFATAGCRVGVLMKTVLPKDLHDVAVWVHDGTDLTADSLYYASTPDADPTADAFALVQRLEVAGRTWSVRYVAQPAFVMPAETALPRQYLLGGLLLSALLTALVWVLAATRARAEELAFAMTQSLRDSEARFREIAENIDQVFFVADPKYRAFSYVSPSFDRIWGRSREALIKDPTLWVGWMHPDDRDRVLDYVATHGGERDYSSEFRIVRADGQVRWIAAHAFNVEVGEGEPARVVGFHTDITGQKEAQGQIASYIQQIKGSNSDLEQFAYVASHDLREPLRMISSYLALIDRRYGEKFDQDGREFLDFARNGAVRMDRLVLDLLDFSRIQRQGRPLETVSLAEVVADAERNLSLLVRESSAKIESDPDALPTVLGDREQLVSLMQNLIGNAVKYRSDERIPLIRISAVRDGADWVVSVADNGIGIEPDYFDRIFRIFQRLHTHEAYDGTGIGLAVCKRIVERHGGRIWVESQPEDGSAFFFTLPAAQ